MVFESIVVDILNKFLGNYVENLDRSQLKIGIWGGDVSLKNLSLKPSALDELDLPVKTIYGHLGKLVLKIPWKNIYTAPVEVSIENLFLLVHPIQDVVYDPVKEEKLKQETKQALINQVELAKKVEKEKDGQKVDDTFVEKLAAQIVKNVQIFIQNIHIRYEDRVTKPERPFSIGISLHTLKLFTTNESCDRYILPQETSPIFYKIMKMEGLSLYWNTSQNLFAVDEGKDSSLLQLFVDGIVGKEEISSTYNYILGPINAEAKLQINSKPEMINFVTPKMYLSLVLDQLLVHLSRSQYQDFIALLETFDRMSKAAPYRKYRPKLNQYRDHYKEWWKFAITCVLEEDIKRKSRNWDWNILRAHRELMKKYQVVYRAKLTEKPNDVTQRELNNMEIQLDAFNIILMRQKVENEVEREGRLTAQQKLKKGGWFSGWFSSNKTQPDETAGSGNDIVKKFENAMTDEEKDKLYRAIDYHENSAPAMYPKSFIAIRLEFILKIFRILVTDDYVPVNENNAVCPVLCIEFKDAFVSVHQRPAAQSFALAIKMQTFQTLGLSQNNIVPQIIKSKLSGMREQADAFLNIYFETNPDDDNYNKKLHVTLRPLKVVYDSQTIIRVLEVFTPEKDISNVKDQLQAVANTKLEEMKEKSAIRLQYAIETSTRLDLKIDLMAPYLILPHGGLYTKNEKALVLNLGRITVSSVDKSGASYNVKRMLSSGIKEDEVLQQLMISCYDHFNITLSEVQILSLQAGETWRPKLEDTVVVDVTSEAHILQPTSLHIDIYKCLVDDDPRLPKMKIDGDLPDITIKITDQKLLEVVSLLLSVPLPQNSSPPVQEVQPETKEDFGSSIYDSAMSLRQKLETVNKMPFSTLKKYNRQNEASEQGSNDDSKLLIDYINLEANFRLKTVTMYVTSSSSDVPVIEASVFGLELTFKQKNYSTEILSKLGKISLTQGYQNSSIPAINTPLTTCDGEQYLFCCRLLIADKSSPLFTEFYDSTAISMKLNFTKLYIVAHQEAILNTLEWVNSVHNQVMSLISQGSSTAQVGESKSESVKRRKTSSASNASTYDPQRKRLRPKSKLAAIVEDSLSETNTTKERKVAVSAKETIELKISIQLDVIQMCIQTASRPIASMDIDGFHGALTLKKSCTNIKLVLQSISVCDLNPDTIYNKVAYISEGKNAFQAVITLNNDVDKESTQSEGFDVLAQVRLTCLQCVFINEFVVNLLEFSNNFQTSKQMLADASAAAVASAKMNMQQVYQSSSRISLDILAEAPVIVVPRNNQSDEIFIIDFGNLSVKNSLKSLARDASGHTPLIDEIYTTLEDMKIVRTNFARTQVESVLLKPVNYTLNIKRNLSSSWYHEVPDFDIDGVFHSIHIEITDRDYKLLMQTLNENIAAAESKNAAKTVSPVVASEAIKSDVAEIEDPSKETVQKETVEVHLETYDEVVRMMMRFSMAIESVTIDLFSGLKENNENDGLAKFTLALLSVRGSILTNGDMSIHAFLSDCCLDDTRSSKITNEVKKYMKRKSAEEIICSNLSGQCRSSIHRDSSSSSLDVSLPSTSYESSSRSMIDVTIQKKMNRTDVNARVFSFILIFNIDYLMQIKDFFLSELTSSSAQTSSSSSPDANKKITPAANAAEMPKNQLVTNSSVTFCSIVIEKPDIILVENLDDINTNAIILNNEAVLKIQLDDDGRLALNGSLKNVQLYSCCYNPELRSQTTSLILHPLTVDLSGATDDDKCMSMNVNVSELMISVTAGTIELLTKISTTLIPNVQNESSIHDVAQNDYSNIWQPNTISDDYWFLRTEKGIDATTLCADDAPKSNDVDVNRKDVIVIAVPTVGVTLEAGVGKKTMPVLALKSSFFGTVQKNFYSMNIESFVTLEMAYYNARLALWEPVIEPITSPHLGSGVSSYSPWKLEMNIEMLNNVNASIEDTCSPGEDVADNSSALSIDNVSSSPAFSLAIKSNERIEVTITKTCMDVIRTLSQSFNNAVYLKSSNSAALSEAGFSSYKFINDFGAEVEVSLKAAKPAEGDTGDSVGANLCEKVAVNSGEDVTLFLKREGSDTRKFGETDSLCLLDKLNMITDKKRFFFDIHILQRNKNLLLPISRADKRYFSIRGQGSSSNGNGQDSWGLISEVEIIDGSVITTLRSVVQVHNHFNVDITVYYLKNEKLCDAGVVSPSQHLNLPVNAVYGSKNHLFFAPERFSMSTEPFAWREIEKNISLSKQLQCQAKNAEHEDPFFIRVLGEMEQVYYENTSSYTIASTSYVIHLRPTLILKNFLPVNVVCCLQGIGTEHTLKPGERMNVSSAEPNHSTIVLRLDDYLDKVWSCKKVIKNDSPVFSVWTFTSYDSETPFSLNLGVWYSNSNESMIFALYCPFWMVNKTGLNLSYKGVEDGGMILHHPKDFDEPILFSFKEKSFFSKKRACVRVNDGNWSDKFSIDAAGSSGAVTCHHNNTSFPLGVYIMLNSNSLTKQVIFSPFYSFANNCTYAIEFRENQTENVRWITIEPDTCIPFWPTAQDDKLKTLELRICGTSEVSASFSYLKIKTYSLMLPNKFGGLQVDVQVNEGGVYIAVSPFNPKMASALIINSTNSAVEFSETDVGESRNKSQITLLQRQNSTNIFRKWQLDAGKEVFFNWSSTFYEEPVLLINKSSESPDRFDSIDLRRDGVGKYLSSDKAETHFWISFLHGMQRILLITPYEYLVKKIEAVGDLSAIQQAIILSLEGIGFSLVNNISRQELLYLSMSSSGVLWETQEKPGKRFKAVKEHLNERLEEMYTSYCNMIKTTNDTAVDADQEVDAGKDGKVVVNFSKLLILRPSYLKLRRTYCSGLWFQIRSSEHYKQIHAKIHRLQVDNQIYDCIFPVIFFPVPPPKSVAIDDSCSSGVEKPFAELSIVQRINEHSTINQFKYFQVLIQEFHVKADIGLINCLVKFFEADNVTDEQELALFQKDTEVTKEPLCVHVSSVTSQDFFDSVHFTPFKIHVSFSLSGDNPNSGTPQGGLPIINLLTQSVGVTLTDVNDVVFKLAYFERKHQFYSQTQLLSEVKTHYIGQFVKQLYVLVLGLDVLGNPFGLVTGFKQGVEDFFYEPFQGAIQGPSEFGEGLLLGVRSLFGHTVGGAVGAVGKITGAMGKGLAALTLDEDYQKKRRQQMAHNQRSIKEGGRGLVMGVVEGVGGVISKPISGAKEEGVLGFAKGAGKGVIGLFTRPVSGVADFASGTLDVVRRAASFSEEVQRYRLPRFIKENGLVVPYSEKYAQGYKLLLELDKGRYSNTDYYVFHLPMSNGEKSDKEILLLTNNRVLYVLKPNDIFCENTRVDWQYTWQEIDFEGGIGETDSGIFIKSQNDVRRPSSFKSMFSHPNKGKILLIRDPNLRKWLLNKMKELIRKPSH